MADNWGLNDDWAGILQTMSEGETRDLGGGFSLTKGRGYDAWRLELTQTQRDPEGDTDGDDDSRQENSPGDTEDGVEHD